MMLRGIPSILPPELIKIMMEMGHGDQILLCDANYPKLGSPERCVRMDGIGIPDILDAMLTLMPLDHAVEHPTTMMAVNPGDDYVPTVWEEYKRIGFAHEKQGLRQVEISNVDFYVKGAACYACVATGERAMYGNIILRKGVIKESEQIGEA